MKRDHRKRSFVWRTALSALLLWIALRTIPPPQPLQIDFASGPLGAQFQALKAARALWRSKHITHYRLIFDWGNSFSNDKPSHFDVEVQENPLHLSSLRSMFSVEGMFQFIEGLVAEPEFLNGIGCDFMVVSVEYDSIIGYPRSIETRQEWVSTANIGDNAYKQIMELRGNRYCYLMGFAGDIVRVKAVILLPKGELI